MWTNDKINKLKELFPNSFNKEIAKELDESLYSINIKRKQLGLEKSKEFKSKYSKMGNLSRIVNGGRDLTYETLKEIASKYKTRIDFIRNDGPAYTTARNKGILEEICEHMTIIKFSIPQLILRDILDNIIGEKSSYNNRKVIKPYEIDVFYKEFNLGFEYQGIIWHNEKYNNGRDTIKKKLIEEKNLMVIYIYEYIDSRNYEKDIKGQLINNLDVINKLTNKNIKKEDIINYKVKNIYLDLYNKNELINITKKYETFKEFKKNEPIVYRKLSKMALINETTKHMKDKKIMKKYSENEIINIIKKYDNLTDFRKKEIKLYKHIKKNKKDYLLNGLNRKQSFNLEDINRVISKYKLKSEFIKENPKMYKYVRRGELKYLLKKFN